MTPSLAHTLSTVGIVWLTASVVYVLGWMGGKRSMTDSLADDLHREYWRGVGDACRRQDERARAAALARVHPLGHPVEIVPASCEWDAWLRVSAGASRGTTEGR